MRAGFPNPLQQLRPRLARGIVVGVDEHEHASRVAGERIHRERRGALQFALPQQFRLRHANRGCHVHRRGAEFRRHAMDERAYRAVIAVPFDDRNDAGHGGRASPQATR